MTLEDAEKIYEVWKVYLEFHDKLFRIFIGKIPESFLPFPKDILVEALGIIGNTYFQIALAKDKENFKEIYLSLGALYVDDEEAIEALMYKLSIPKVRKSLLEHLKEAHMEWFKINMKKNQLNLEDTK